jgi:tRNA (guanine37-N1)-methyltransferase
MWFGILSLFPEMFSSLTDYGVTARAVENKRIEVDFSNPRDFATDRHQTVDDRPYGGGPGMVMKADILLKALEHLKEMRAKVSPKKVKVIYLSPVGTKLTQAKVRSLALESELILIAGRYEGIDQRFIDTQVDESLSIGDYVVSGGELPAMVLMDAIIRLQPGVLGHPQSCEQDSFNTNQLLDYPHYTRPEVWQNKAVPEVLLSGHHQNIERWRQEEALKLTQRYRSDLLENEQEKI